MTEGTGARDRLERLMYVLPAAGREDGATLEELARALDTTKERILEDLEQVTERAYYHPGGWPDDVSILIEAGRVRVLHASGFDRPVRLSPRETLCLALALRSTAAASHVADSEKRAELLRRAERHLAALPPGAEDEGPPDAVHAGDLEPDPAGIRETLLAATRDRHACAIVYAKASADDLEVRVVHPYAILHAGGEWYVIALCTVKEGIRVFRIDRIVDAAEADATFEVPDDFDPLAYVHGHRVYRADDDVKVRVRYSPRIARWVREGMVGWTTDWMEDDDGGLVASHRVADPHWVVNHALTYGAEAEILEPEEMRDLVREVVGRMVG
jgi:proteasome accessory factor C